MNNTELIASARLITCPSAGAAAEFEEKREMLAAAITRAMRSRPDLERLIGAGNESMMEDNHRNHARFIASLIANFQAEVLVETVLWVFRAYRSHGFQLTYWPAQLDLWVELFRIHLSPETFNEIYPLYHWMIINQPSFAAASEH
jgi:hypothetical protein